ncbi:MAG TPA: sulfite oxidase-like oxidoreductase [Terriglobales bacterium]|nr:sulfite oxidase-like oxidoreductase [Terriglobales bacterium]
MFSGVFSGNERRQLEAKMKAAGRLPPNQALTLKWPVLHYGSVPHFDPARWDLKLFGAVESPLRFTWDEFNRLPRVRVTSDFHCVTRWSRFDNHWEGVAFRELLKRMKPKPGAKYVLIHGEQGYTANVPLADLDRDNVLLATHHDGSPLTAEHGGPLRLIVPHLYAWKSVKWLRGFEFQEQEHAGFWERNGYHIYGDPFKEQRFDTD